MNDKISIRKLPPAWVLEGINALRRILLSLHGKLLPAGVVLYEKIQFLWLLPCLRVAAELDIAGILKDGPLTAEEIAHRTDSHPGYLFRVLRAMASQGIFRQGRDGRFRNTGMSKALMDGKGSLRHMIIQHLGRLNWTVFGSFPETVKTGEDAFTKIYGQRIYDFLSSHPDEAGLFDRSMTNITYLAVEPLLSVYDFSHFKTIADIGGGEGLLLASILYKNSQARGILFDLPGGLKHASSLLKSYGVEDRVTMATGSFFETAPAGADAYILKNILHNWSDEECIRILSPICSVLPENGKVLILEMVIEEDNAPSFGKLIDIQMMVFMKEGRERTVKEFRELLSKAGLKIERIVRTAAPFSVIEARRI
jgi:hypothetical protein